MIRHIGDDEEEVRVTSAAKNASSWPFCTRKIYCAGGSLAICDNRGNYRTGPTINGEWTTASLRKYEELTSDLRTSGLQPLATEFAHRTTHFQNLESPDLKFNMAPIGSMRWPSSDVQQRWFEIGHGAAKAKHLNLFLASSHLSSQIGVCRWHLLLLCQAYTQQAVALTKSGNFCHMATAASYYSDEMNYAATAAFASIATLRDFVSKAAAVIVFGSAENSADSYSGLIEKMKKNCTKHKLSGTILNSESWLKPFSRYRNFAIHKAPLSMLPEIQFVQQIEARVGSHLFGQVAMHLPAKIDETSVKNLITTDEKEFESWAKCTFDFKRSNAGPDTLKYLHETFENILKFAFDVSEQSPVAPELPILNGPFNIKRD